MNYRKLVSATLLSGSLVLLALVATPVNSSTSSVGSQQSAVPFESVAASAKQALTPLQSAAKGEVLTQVSRQTGSYSFVRAGGGGVLVTDDVSATPQARALAFLANHGDLVGMNGVERAALGVGGAPAAGSDLRLAKTERDAIGMTHVKLDQFYRGLPVFGAQLVVHMNGKGITAVNGKYVPEISLSNIPALTDKAAGERVLTALRKHGGADLKVKKAELSVYPAGLLEGTPVRSVLAYGVEVQSRQLHEQVWIDAQNGAILNRIPLRETALDRRVYSPQYDPDNPDMFVVHREGDPLPPPSIATPTVNLYHFTGQVYNFFSSAFGRDSYDAHGITMRTVYLVNDQCPNAYWDGQATNYCPEVDADDVVAHEWGHAYTQFTHDLIYSYQSGALNESYSDIWGETVDLNNAFDGEGGSNNDDPRPDGQRWQIGEDVQGLNQPALGILRNMWDPTEYSNPDKVSSEFYHCDSSDGGGVHTNSGVPNHAYALLVDGTSRLPDGKFNKVAVAGIGFVKAIAIYFRAMTVYQTRTTDFPEHEQALKTSCQDLVGQPLKNFSTTDPVGKPAAGQVITQADCQQVAAATQAVEMSAAPPCNFAPLLQPGPPPICSGSSTIFSEDWETGDDGWTRTSTGVFADWEDSSRPIRDFKIRASLPEGKPGSAAYAKNPPIGEPGGGTCQPGGDYSGQFTIDSPEITIPAGATGVHLKFDHFVATEVTFDGGQVEISKNGGEYQLVPQDQYVFNPPNAQFDYPPPVGSNTNPNAGEFAWNGTNVGSQSGSWGSTVADLAEMVAPGDKIKIRFTYSQDGCNGVDGWYVDNIRLYNCPVLKAPVLSIGAGYENPDTNGSYTLNWTRPAGASGPDTLQESTTSCAPQLFDNAESGIDQWTVSTDGAYSGFNWETSTEKPEHESTTFRARAAEATANASAILTHTAPIAIPATGTTTLAWSDWNMNEGDDAVFVEVSQNGTDWTPVYSDQRNDLAPFQAEVFATEPLTPRQVNLGAYKGKTIHLRFRYALGPDNRAGSSPFGWYLDDISITNDNWADVATVNATSAIVSGRGTGNYCYRVSSTYTFGSVTAPSPESNIVNIRVAPGVIPKVPASLQNISTRGRVLKGDNVLIGGIIVTGNVPKRVLLRGLGPSISSNNTPVIGRMTNPTLQLYGPNGLIRGNDDWKQSQQAEIQATGIPPEDDREAAILATLNPGAYTAVLRGKNDETGIAVVEAYDLNVGADAELANISTRGFVQPGDDVLIGGFIAGPETRGTTSVLIRALGPSVPVNPRLPDPTLEIVNSNGTSIAVNDNWKQGGQQADIAATGIPPENDLEAAILMPTLAHGSYTAIVRGKGNTVGTGLVEIYNLQ